MASSFLRAHGNTHTFTPALPRQWGPLAPRPPLRRAEVLQGSGMLVLYDSEPAERLAQRVLVKRGHRGSTFFTSTGKAEHGQTSHVLSTNVLEHKHFQKLACANTVLPPHLQGAVCSQKSPSLSTRLCFWTRKLYRRTAQHNQLTCAKENFVEMCHAKN